MSNRKKCQSTNSRGEPCGNSPQRGSEYCRYHSSSSKIDTDSQNESSTEQFNKECPACFSSDGDFHLMPCMHRIHLDCAEHLTSLTCPLCRADINNFPRHIANSIASNEKSYQDDLEEEDRRTLAAREREISESIGNMALYTSPPAQVEILAAFQFLRNEGIPLSYIPANVRVALPNDSPRPSRGALFYAILAHVMDKINQDISSGSMFDELQPEPYVSEEDLSDEENPFEWENENLSVLNRSVEVCDDW